MERCPVGELVGLTNNVVLVELAVANDAGARALLEQLARNVAPSHRPYTQVKYEHVGAQGHETTARNAHLDAVERARALARRRHDTRWRLVGIEIRTPAGAEAALPPLQRRIGRWWRGLLAAHQGRAPGSARRAAAGYAAPPPRVVRHRTTTRWPAWRACFSDRWTNQVSPRPRPCPRHRRLRPACTRG
jgi:hypothetical protein